MSEDNLIIYGSNVEDDLDEELVSDKVQLLANNIYREFENIIELHGSGTVDGLAPLIINVLETMDKLYSNRDELVMKLEMLKKDQGELFTQYEREKNQRKIVDNKLCCMEDQFESERQELEIRLEHAESANKMLEMKLKNSRELVNRVEEKESELRKEHSALQQRYADLLLSLKSTTDISVTEKSKHTDECGHDATHNHVGKLNSEPSFREEELPLVNETDKDLNNEIELPLTEKPLKDCQVNSRSLKEEIEDHDFMCHSPQNLEKMSVNFPNDDDDDDTKCVMDADVDDDGFNMEREIKFLIKENQELSETKMALNIVKDDLITRLDELTGELYVTQEELKSCTRIKKEYKAQLGELEKRLHTLEEARDDDNCSSRNSGHDMVECQVDVGGKCSITKITREEISRILVERNKFKEELMELRDLIRYQSSTTSTNQKSGGTNIYKLFSNVLSTATDTIRYYSLNEPSSSNQNQPNPTRANQIEVSEYPQMRMQTTNIPGSAQRVSTNPLLAQFEQPHTQMNDFDLLPPQS